jgi:hypothetical protein
VRIFLSCRRSDVGGHAARLADSLAQRLGPRTVFQDVTDIPCVASHRLMQLLLDEANLRVR